MKLLEFASAEEQLALWKLISDNIWDAIEEQARIEREEKAKAKPLKPMRQPRAPAAPKAQTSPPVPLPPPKKAEDLDSLKKSEEVIGSEIDPESTSEEQLASR